MTKDTFNAEKATIYSKIYAVDFGAGKALAFYGPNGPMKPPKIPRNARGEGKKSDSEKFIQQIEVLLQLGDVVFESATVGSSGCEVAEIKTLQDKYTTNIYTVSNRAKKNYTMDHGMTQLKGQRPYEVNIPNTQEDAHEQSAEILYKIATTTPERLRLWKPSNEEPLVRSFTSVRPLDKRDYKDEESDKWMENLPPFESLPEDLQQTVGIEIKSGPRRGEWDYQRSLVFPFAMLLKEPYLTEGPEEGARKRFDKLVGWYDHGYPSFYRRMANSWMQKIAANMFGLKQYKRDAVSKEDRKKALKISKRQLRQLFHLSWHKD